MWHHSFPLINRFNVIEAAILPMHTMLYIGPSYFPRLIPLIPVRKLFKSTKIIKQMYSSLIKLMKGKAPIKHSMHVIIAALTVKHSTRYRSFFYRQNILWISQRKIIIKLLRMNCHKFTFSRVVYSLNLSYMIMTGYFKHMKKHRVIYGITVPSMKIKVVRVWVGWTWTTWFSSLQNSVSVISVGQCQ